MPAPEKYNVGAFTDTFITESHKVNEDSFFADGERGNLGIFDGLGGYEGGTAASRIASRVISNSLKGIPEETSSEHVISVLRGAWKDAKAAINSNKRQIAKAHPQMRDHLRGMGTTATVAKVFKENGRRKLAVAHSGNTRLYLVKRDGTVICLTEDQNTLWTDRKKRQFSDSQATLIRERIDEADSEKDFGDIKGVGHYWDYRGSIDNCLGGALDREENHVFSVRDLEDDDVAVFATTDGIHHNLTASHIGKIIRYDITRNFPPQYTVGRLVEAAKHKAQIGGLRSTMDDMTAVGMSLIENPPIQ
jgi:serine/threonine protein phosphatase PrpC